MKVLITGGAGYKGAVLACRLLDEGHHVSILDNFVYGFDSILHLVNHQNLEIIRQDVRNLTSETLRSCDVIYHLAGLSGYPRAKQTPIPPSSSTWKPPGAWQNWRVPTSR